jgi:hypothetical protein
MGSTLITWRTLTAALATAGLAGALALPDEGLSGRAAQVTFRPVADAYVTASAPRRNFGKASMLRGTARPRGRPTIWFPGVPEPRPAPGQTQHPSL